MIFRRKTDPVSADSPDEPVDELADGELADAELADDEPADGETADEAAAAALTDDELRDEWLDLDLSRDWREDGPFDIAEVDLDADDVTRVDLGALIVTPQDGFKLQLVVDRKTQVTTTLIAAADDAALHVQVLAAPASSGYTAEVREQILAAAEAAGHAAELAAGPFGTEIRRRVTVSGDGGQEGVAPLRDWLVEGPRWLLHAELRGRAALDTAARGPAAELEEFFRNLVVRRGEAAIVPGAPVPLRPPGRS
ncbi:MAG: DUF3710 domain-containing protein [Propionibacteriaceae bacterium]|nr:DUF3710 domain-containing protein [Propionibacteriaceae bacterium]